MRLASMTIVLVACAALLPAALDAATGGPALRIVDREPLTLAGKAFRAGEIVRVVVRSGANTRVRKASVGATGTFRLAFAGVRLDRCSGGLEVTASGTRGSRVSLELVQLDCGDRADD